MSRDSKRAPCVGCGSLTYRKTGVCMKCHESLMEILRVMKAEGFELTMGQLLTPANKTKE